MKELTQKQENFTQNLFKGLSQREAYIQAGYSGKQLPATLDENAWKLSNNKGVVARLVELNQKTEDKSVMTVLERKQKLSIIGRANLTSFQTAGADGSWIDIGPENEYAGALQEITSRTEYDKDGSNPAVITKIKLHSPVQSIKELNLMEKVYEMGAIVDARVFNILVSKDTKGLLEQVSKRTELTGGEDAIQGQGEAEGSDQKGSTEA